GVQQWSRNAFGVDWSPLVSNVVVGNFSLTGCTGCTDVILQGVSSGKTSSLVTGNASGAIFSTGSTLASNVTWTADSYHLIAATSTGSTAAAGVYFQSTSSGGTDYFADSVTGSSVTVITHDPSAPTGVVPATAVGSTSGSFAVTSNGAATYAIPIAVPAGVN